MIHFDKFDTLMMKGWRFGKIFSKIKTKMWIIWAKKFMYKLKFKMQQIKSLKRFSFVACIKLYLRKKEKIKRDKDVNIQKEKNPNNQIERTVHSFE